MKKAAKKGNFIQQGKMDIGFLSLVLILLTVGLIMLFSASYAYALTYFNDSFHFIKRQALFAVVGLIVMFALSKVNYHWYKKHAWLLYGVSFAMLALLLIMPPMISGVEYKRWMVIGPISFQPSEIAKFAIILLFSVLISKNQDKMKDYKFTLLKLLPLLGCICGLVLFETHLSATILICLIGVVLMIVGGAKFSHMFSAGLAAVGAGAIAILTGIVSYGSSRFTYWLDPWKDATGLGYQTIQSLLAIGSGGLMGRGLGQSRQKYLWVPEPHNDFIFSVTCEELGYIGAIVIILLFVALVWRGFVIAMKAPDKYGSLMALGLTFQVGIQAAFNILVVTNTIPNTGISLPFFSYGGTALMILLAEMGIVLSISRGASLEKV